MAMAFAPDKVKSEAAKKAVYRLISQTKTIATDDDAEKEKAAAIWRNQVKTGVEESLEGGVAPGSRDAAADA